MIREVFRELFSRSGWVVDLPWAGGYARIEFSPSERDYQKCGNESGSGWGNNFQNNAFTLSDPNGKYFYWLGQACTYNQWVMYTSLH